MSVPIGDVPRSQLARTLEILGGSDVFFFAVRSTADLRRTIAIGIPLAAVDHLVIECDFLARSDPYFEISLGISRRALDALRVGSDRLPSDLSMRVWMFADILGQAEEAFGSRTEAMEWLRLPQLSLGRRRPIDLLATRAGYDILKEQLLRIDRLV